MRVRAVALAGTGAVWLLEGLPLSVRWPGPGLPLYLETFPWPGDEEGVREPVGADRYGFFPAADHAARLFIAKLPG